MVTAMNDSDATVVAGRLVATLGGCFSREMGIDVDGGDDEVERWLVAATLFGTRISAAIAVRTYRLMAENAAGTLAGIERRGRDELIELLDRSGYARYDERTATRLRDLAATLQGRGIRALRRGDLAQTRAALDALPGWGPVTVALFLRELRGIWPGIDPPVDEHATAAAYHAGLLGVHDQPLKHLRAIAARAGLDVRDVEASLVRLWLAHHREFDRCPGGRRCSAVSASADDLVDAARAAGVSDQRLLNVIRTTPRNGFVPAEYAGMADDDGPIPIGHGQVTTQPSLSARMIEGLDLRGDEHVLEIGTGLGFQTALLARLAADVVSIEWWPDLAEQARRNLAQQGITNVELRVGDGSGGVKERAPYDAVIVSAAFPEVPARLIEQLRIGGRLVQPIGPGGQEDVVAFQRTAEGLERRQTLTWARFVRLHGRYGFSSDPNDAG